MQERLKLKNYCAQHRYKVMFDSERYCQLEAEDRIIDFPKKTSSQSEGARKIINEHDSNESMNVSSNIFEAPLHETGVGLKSLKRKRAH